MATKDAVLQALQNSEGAFLSGEELSNKLSVSRTTVWKAIKLPYGKKDILLKRSPIAAICLCPTAGPSQKTA